MMEDKLFLESEKADEQMKMERIKSLHFEITRKPQSHFPEDASLQTLPKQAIQE